MLFGTNKVTKAVHALCTQHEGRKLPAWKAVYVYLNRCLQKGKCHKCFETYHLEKQLWEALITCSKSYFHMYITVLRELGNVTLVCSNARRLDIDNFWTAKFFLLLLKRAFYIAVAVCYKKACSHLSNSVLKCLVAKLTIRSSAFSHLSFVLCYTFIFIYIAHESHDARTPVDSAVLVHVNPVMTRLWKHLKKFEAS